jgi:hypothetical protein
MGGFDHMNDALAYAAAGMRDTTIAFKGLGDAIRGREIDFIIFDEWADIESGAASERACAVQAELEATPGYGTFS